MPEVSYDGIVLPYCKTTQYSQDTVYADNTDAMRTDITLSVETYFTSEYLLLLSPTTVGRTESPATIMQIIRSRLLTPRKQLEIKCAGVSILPAMPVGNRSPVDIASGPQPQHCNVMQMNNSTFIVTWSVKASYWENTRVIEDEDDGGPFVAVRNRQGNGVISCRWSETQDIDNCLYTTLIREGKYVIRTDNSEQWVADQFRERFAILGVPFGFLRESSHYTVSPDGLTLSFRITDKEVFKMPPTPAYEARGTYTEQTMKYGAQRFGEIRLSLKGAKTSDQGKMILAALGIMSNKLQANGVQKNLAAVGNRPARSSVIEFCNLSVGMYDNTVEVYARARMLQAKRFANPEDAKKGDGKYWGWNAAALAFTPGSDEADVQRPPQYPIGGTAGPPGNRILLVAASYYDPSLRTTTVDQVTGNFIPPLPAVGTLGKV